MIELSPEGSGFNRKVENRIDKEALIRLAYSKALKIINDYSIKEAEFKDIYDADNVEADLQEVKKIESLIAQERDNNIIENTKLSEIFNAIILEQFEKNNWMGENAFTTGTSRIDKYKTGVGNITEFRKENGISYMAMAVNVTFSPNNLEKKLLKIRENIKNGELLKIKYFVSDEHRGELRKVPNVIVGCSKEMLLEVVELWLQNKNRALAEHHLQFLILEQIKEQIIFFKKEAAAGDKIELVDKYEKILNNIREILMSKSELREKLESPQEGDSLEFKKDNDRVMLALEEGLKKVFGK